MNAIAAILVPVTLALGAATERADAVEADRTPTFPSPAVVGASAPAVTGEVIAIDADDGVLRGWSVPQAGEASDDGPAAAQGDRWPAAGERDRWPAPGEGDRWPAPAKGHQKGGFDFAWFA